MTDRSGHDPAAHPTLARQLRRHKLAATEAPTAEQWRAFLAAVSDVYRDNDSDRSLLERAMEVSSGEMRSLNSKLAEQAATDSLTGLLNRSSLMSELESILNAGPRSQTWLGVLFLDLDGFKLINDRRGHAAGDDLLRVVADRLEAGTRSCDVVARLGGDEFVVLAPDLSDADHATELAYRLTSAISQTITLPGHPPIGVGTSVGVTSLASGQTRSAEALLIEADAAMYSAKLAGRNNVAVFTSDTSLAADSGEPNPAEDHFCRPTPAAETSEIGCPGEDPY